MGNTLQSNPSDATDGFVQPDWNSKNGVGVEPGDDAAQDFGDIYERQRAGAKERVEAKND
jgi:hypothetical protein